MIARADVRGGKANCRATPDCAMGFTPMRR